MESFGLHLEEDVFSKNKSNDGSSNTSYSSQNQGYNESDNEDSLSSDEEAENEVLSRGEDYDNEPEAPHSIYSAFNIEEYIQEEEVCIRNAFECYRLNNNPQVNRNRVSKKNPYSLRGLALEFKCSPQQLQR